MKYIYITTLVLFTITISSCKKESTGNGDPKVTIERPNQTQEPEPGNKLRFKASFEDGAGLSSVDIKITSSITGGSAYVDQTRGLSGTSDELDLMLDLPLFNLLGNSLLTVVVTNKDGGETVSDLDFTLVDYTKPVIAVNDAYSVSPQDPGTPYSKFDYEVNDNYELAKVKREFYTVDGAGNEVNVFYTSETNIPLFESTHVFFDDMIYLSSGPNPGTNYRARITAEDAAGNVEVWVSAVKQM